MSPNAMISIDFLRVDIEMSGNVRLNFTDIQAAADRGRGGAGPDPALRGGRLRGELYDGHQAGSQSNFTGQITRGAFTNTGYSHDSRDDNMTNSTLLLRVARVHQ